MEFQQLNKKALACMYMVSGIVAAITIAVLCFIVFYFSLFSYFAVKIIFFAVLALLAIDCLIAPPFRYRRYCYAVDEECIHVKEGYLWLKEQIVPIERLQKIAMAQGPVDRMFGLSKVIVTTAGGDVTIQFLEYEKGQSISDSLKKKINRYALEEQNENR